MASMIQFTFKSLKTIKLRSHTMKSLQTRQFISYIGHTLHWNASMSLLQ